MKQFLGVILAMVLLLRFVNGEERRIENVRYYGHCNWGKTLFVKLDTTPRKEIFFSTQNIISVEEEDEDGIPR